MVVSAPSGLCAFDFMDNDRVLVSGSGSMGYQAARDALWWEKTLREVQAILSGDDIRRVWTGCALDHRKLGSRRARPVVPVALTA